MLIEEVIFALVYGWSMAQVAKFLDLLMDYGHPLWRVRYWAAVRSAKKAGVSGQLVAALNRARRSEFADAIEVLDSFYWQIASLRHGFTPWVCIVCLGTRVALVGIIAMCFFVNSQLIFILFSYSAAFYYLRK